MTILHDLLPIGVKAAQRGLTGVYNYTNPGAISHNQILDLYKKYIDPSFTYANFTEEEQNKILKAGRSNNELVYTLPPLCFTLSVTASQRHRCHSVTSLPDALVLWWAIEHCQIRERIP
jgi:hypothetical protein